MPEFNEAEFTDALLTVRKNTMNRAMHMLRSHEDAEDCLQEAATLAWQKYAQFLGHCELATWITRIFINRVLQKMRSNRGPRAFRYAPLEPTDEHIQIGFAPNQESSLINAEREWELKVEINRLPESQQVVLRFLLFDGSCPPLNHNTFKIRKYRGIQTLQKHFQLNS